MVDRVNEYFIQPRFGGLFKKRWRFDLYRNVMVWEDPSYGNGGGDYVKAIRKVSSFSNELDARKACDTFNRYSTQRTNQDCENCGPQPPKGR